MSTERADLIDLKHSDCVGMKRVEVDGYGACWQLG